MAVNLANLTEPDEEKKDGNIETSPGEPKPSGSMKKEDAVSTKANPKSEVATSTTKPQQNTSLLKQCPVLERELGM